MATSMRRIDRRVDVEARNVYRMDRAGMAILVNSEMLRAPVVHTAERLKAYCQFLAASEIYTGGPSISTAGSRRRTGATGNYLASFKVRSRRNGGVHRDRVEAIVYNDAPSAFWVEFGHHGREPYRIMARASFDMKAGFRP